MAGSLDELMVSISGVRGTVGGSFTPEVVHRYVRAFGEMQRPGSEILLGRDSRPSGPWIIDLAAAVLSALGHRTRSVGLCGTPTLGYAIRATGAAGGIMATASHNPAPWNALKMFGADGGFVTPALARRVFARADAAPRKGAYVAHDDTGRRTEDCALVSHHLKAVLDLLPLRAPKTRFKVVLDTVNGAGCVLVPEYLRRQGCRVIEINQEPTGRFAHPPEPLPGNLAGLSRAVRKARADIGIAVDPDVDRVAFVDETGRPIGEELSLGIAAAFVLAWRPGPVVVNLSTSRVAEELAFIYGQKFFRTPVGEAHVAAKMRATGAAVGGEGNGGVIYPSLHPGRDALVGMAFLLALMRRRKARLSEVAAALPQWYLVRHAMACPRDYDARLRQLLRRLPAGRVDRRDGVRIDWPHGWVQMRKSNTEPIVRILAEAQSPKRAQDLLRATLRQMQLK